MKPLYKINPPYKVEMIRITEEGNLSSIVDKYGISRTQILNNNTHFKKGDILLVSCQNKHIHIVMPNQSIDDISKLYNIPASEILSKNNSKTIFIGQILQI